MNAISPSIRAAVEAGEPSIVSILEMRARLQPDDIAYSFIQADPPAQEITYGELWDKVAGLAGELLEHAFPGDRLLLAMQPGLDYVVALYACLLGRLIAVPTFPPRARRLSNTLQAIVDNCSPAAILSDPASCPAVLAQSLRRVNGNALPVLLSSGRMAAGPWSPPLPCPEDIALLQYTSGSTGRPKGVVLRHGNLIDNLAWQQEVYRVSEASRGVIWLPPYHDMGLGSGILQPVYSNSQILLMSPMHAMQRPMRWLRAISDTRATVSGAPPFAYAACIGAAEDELEGLDLSSWTCAFVGAEPISMKVLEQFAARFARCGFDARAFQPCYGLAEATLLVTSACNGEGAERHPAFSTAGDQRVNCGRPIGGHDVLVVDPQSSRPVGDREEGEIWIRGPSVAAGYWNDPQTTDQVFGATLDGGSDRYLRTGDLGVLTDGELAVTGRIRDIIVIAGRNLHAEDVEASVRGIEELSDAAMAAFGVEVDGRERLVVSIESRHAIGDRAGALAPLGGKVSATLAGGHDVTVHQVDWVAPGVLARTSSGKIRRHLCSQDYAGRLAAQASGAMA